MTPGVDVGMLIDMAMSDATLAEADIGDPEACEFTWESLPELSGQLLRTVLGRARRYGRLPAAAAAGLREAPQRIAVELSLALDEPPAIAGLALFMTEGVLFREAYPLALARRTGCELQRAGILGDAGLSAADQVSRIASLLRSFPREVLRDTAHHIPLTPGAQQAVLALRRAGYRVGVVSTGFPDAAEIVRQRVGADFAVNALLEWNRSCAEETAASVDAPAPADGCCGMRDCLRPLLLALCKRLRVDLQQVVVIGSREQDSCLLRAAGQSIAFEPATEAVRTAATHVLREDLSTLPALLGIG
jgi:phosphoserine phosphatase